MKQSSPCLTYPTLVSSSPFYTLCYAKTEIVSVVEATRRDRVSIQRGMLDQGKREEDDGVLGSAIGQDIE